MPSNQFSKQTQQLSQVFGGFLNGGAGDTVLGGRLTGVPAEITASQGNSDRPGDRLVLGMADADALSDADVGQLYGGVYQYVQTVAGSTNAATRTRACFWRTASADDDYVVTPDETQGEGANLWAGVYINTLTRGNFAWIQVAGKTIVTFTTPLTGVGADGIGVFIAADTVGRFDVFGGVGTNPTFDQVQSMIMRYAGVAESAPAANTASIIDIPLRLFRW